MTAMYPCERVGPYFIDNAPIRFANSVDLAIDQLWEVLADAGPWPRWAKVATKVTWTSPEPRGVGATRTADVRGIVVSEEFLAWDPYSHMAFRGTECSALNLVYQRFLSNLRRYTDKRFATVQDRPSHAERLTASGSSMVTSRADRMTRVRRRSV